MNRCLDAYYFLQLKIVLSFFIYHLYLLQIWSKVDVVENQYKNKNDHANAKFSDLQTLEKNTGTGLIYSRKGKPIAEKVNKY